MNSDVKKWCINIANRRESSGHHLVIVDAKK